MDHTLLSWGKFVLGVLHFPNGVGVLLWTLAEHIVFKLSSSNDNITLQKNILFPYIKTWNILYYT